MTCVFVLPYFMLGQDQIWYKTEKEVKKLIQGDWAIVSRTFERKAETIDKTYGFSVYKKKDSLKLDSFYYINNKKEEKESNFGLLVHKRETKFSFCKDYDYKISCQEIRYIDSTKVILEQGPNISIYKRIKN